MSVCVCVCVYSFLYPQPQWNITKGYWVWLPGKLVNLLNRFSSADESYSFASSGGSILGPWCDAWEWKLTIEAAGSPWVADGTKMGYLVYSFWKSYWISIAVNGQSPRFLWPELRLECNHVTWRGRSSRPGYFFVAVNTQMRVKNFLQPTPRVMLCIFFLDFKSMS